MSNKIYNRKIAILIISIMEGKASGIVIKNPQHRDVMNTGRSKKVINNSLNKRHIIDFFQYMSLLPVIVGHIICAVIVKWIPSF